jgi:hypothetical protein
MKKINKDQYIVEISLIIDIATKILSSVKAIDAIFNGGIFSFLCNKKENKAKDELAAIMSVLPEEFFTAKPQLAIERKMLVDRLNKRKKK